VPLEIGKRSCSNTTKGDELPIWAETAPTRSGLQRTLSRRFLPFGQRSLSALSGPRTRRRSTSGRLCEAPTRSGCCAQIAVVAGRFGERANSRAGRDHSRPAPRAQSAANLHEASVRNRAIWRRSDADFPPVRVQDNAAASRCLDLRGDATDRLRREHPGVDRRFEAAAAESGASPVADHIEVREARRRGRGQAARHDAPRRTTSGMAAT
jgi:hypothetical protein